MSRECTERPAPRPEFFAWIRVGSGSWLPVGRADTQDGAFALARREAARLGRLDCEYRISPACETPVEPRKAVREPSQRRRF
jgi:hypothetical protein